MSQREGGRRGGKCGNFKVRAKVGRKSLPYLLITLLLFLFIVCTTAERGEGKKKREKKGVNVYIAREKKGGWRTKAGRERAGCSLSIITLRDRNQSLYQNKKKGK